MRTYVDINENVSGAGSVTSPVGEVLKSLKAGTGSPDIKSGAVAAMIIMIMAVTLLSACGGKTGAQTDAADSAVQQDDNAAVTGAEDGSFGAADQASGTENTSGNADQGEGTKGDAPLADGVYTAVFTTDGSMFHVNDAYDNRGELKVENGVMTLHIAMTSKNILNLYPGSAQDAQKDGAKLLEPTVEEVAYPDGTKEEVNAFDVVVPALDEEFDLALIGSKGKWYDHKVSVSDVKPGTLAEYFKVGEDGAVNGAEDTGNGTKDGSQGLVNRKKELPGLEYKESMELSYAKNFIVDYYDGGYKFLYTGPDEDKHKYLIVPEGKDVPEIASGDVTVLKQPIDNIYISASSMMQGYVVLGELDNLDFSSKDKGTWNIPEANEAMEKGGLKFVGKYNAPDYEQLIAGDCDLVLESTMILHAPEVAERFEELGIPMLIDHSGYEVHPLARAEWIKVTGALFDDEEKAAELFDEQKYSFEKAIAGERTDKTIAFFFVNSEGLVQIRQGQDYVSGLIDMVGGKYVFADMNDDSSSRKTTMNISMEEFYSRAKDADYLIYNAAIDDDVASVDDLLKENELFADFKAVKNGDVWMVGPDFYQKPLAMGDMAMDLRNLMTTQDRGKMFFLKHLD